MWNAVIIYYLSFLEKYFYRMVQVMSIAAFTRDSFHSIDNFLFFSLNALTTNVPHDKETSQLICIANQLTGFYMMGNIGH